MTETAETDPVQIARQNYAKAALRARSREIKDQKILEAARKALDAALVAEGDEAAAMEAEATEAQESAQAAQEEATQAAWTKTEAALTERLKAAQAFDKALAEAAEAALAFRAATNEALKAAPVALSNHTTAAGVGARWWMHIVEDAIKTSGIVERPGLPGQFQPEPPAIADAVEEANRFVFIRLQGKELSEPARAPKAHTEPSPSSIVADDFTRPVGRIVDASVFNDEDDGDAAISRANAALLAPGEVV